MPQSDDFMSALAEPAATTPSGATTGISPTQRLQMAMRMASDQDPTTVDPPTDFSNFRVGVPNPYGKGIHAYEPNNVIFTAYTEAYNASQDSKAAEKANADTTNTIPQSATGTLGDATGKVGTAIGKALELASRAVPYVWGGTTANGVDCSGLLYYAFNAAGIKMPRYRAVDYGHMGQAVTVAQARPGDIIYYDEPGNTDHVGIYLGNGKMVQAPTTGDHVRVSNIGTPTSIRRIFDDNEFGAIATPNGGVMTSYQGQPFNPGFTAGTVGQIPGSWTAPGSTGSTIVRPPVDRRYSRQPQ